MPSEPSNPSFHPAIERSMPLLELLKIRPVSTGHGTAELEMRVEERHLRTLGLLHGGVTATLLDTAMGYAAMTTAPEGHYVVTIQLNVNYIRPAWRGESLRATGQIVHSGRQTAVARGELRTADGTLVAAGTATFMSIPHPTDGTTEIPKT